MPELRKDAVTDTWVIIASERGKRPLDFARVPEVKKGGVCPFCPGNEEKTPPEVLAYRPGGGPSDSPGWTVRVVPNKFPALRIEGDLEEKPGGLHPHMNGVGAHEVIIESPDHDASPGKEYPGQVAETLRAIRDRYQDLRGDRRFKYIQLSLIHISEPTRPY